MPWPGDPADDELPDDPPAEPGGGPRRPLPPEDRLWRHPSELTPPAGTPVAAPPPPAVRPARLWTVVVTSGLSGAALALAAVAVVGGFGDEVTERVVERVSVDHDLVDSASQGAAGAVAVAEHVSPSIVRIDARGGDADATASGSGVVIADDGTILTNAHVVAGTDTVTIVLADGTGLPGHVVGSDEATDVAVVVVDDTHRDRAEWVPAVLGSADGLRVGEPAVAIGSPLGLVGGPSVTVGVVSALGRRVVADGQVLHDMIQTDAPIANGSSGGALCDAAGVVVGLTTAVGSNADSNGLGFAIPIEVASDVADRLVAEGAVRWVWLGIDGRDLGPTENSMPGMAQTGGVKVETVTAGGPADLAGVTAGDVVIAVDAVRITTMSDLVVALRNYAPGDTVELRLRRGADDVRVTATLAERPG